jgi:hypothetical protein
MSLIVPQMINLDTIECFRRVVELEAAAAQQSIVPSLNSDG